MFLHGLEGYPLNWRKEAMWQVWVAKKKNMELIK
jgi:hypothetical protein